MKQFVIQVEAACTHDRYLSDQYYFNSFAFVNESIERVVPLRNLTKQKYDKRYLKVKETSRLRTKVLEFSAPVVVNNKSSYSLWIEFNQVNVVGERIVAAPNSELPLSMWLK